MAADGLEEGVALRALLVIVLVATIVGGAVDLYLDAPESLVSAHVIYELALMLVAVATSILLWRGWWRSRHLLAAAERKLAENTAERDAWRARAESALAGLAHAIDEQFAAWGLTDAEREVALLLLKGRSHKQIAFAMGRSERTVRQHAVVVYQKSGLNGRAELAAFFLGDLMLPRPRDNQPLGAGHRGFA